MDLQGKFLPDQFHDISLTYGLDGQVYGHEKVSVIDGGLPRAKKEGVKLEIGPPTKFEVSHPAPVRGSAI